MDKLLDEYITDKITISGHRVECSSFSVPIRCNFKREYEIKKDRTKGNEKREDNLARARKKVRQIIWANLSQYTKFLTLTCSNTCLDVKEFKRHLTTFFQAMKRNGYDLRYLYVLERQKERGEKEGNIGSLHAHLVVFNDEYIDLDILNKCWHYGSTDLHILNGLRQSDYEQIKDVAAYVCKYVTKESVAEWNQRTFNCSLNLFRACEFNITCFSDGLVYHQSNDELQHNVLELYQSSNITYRGQKIVTNEDKTFTQIIDYQQGVI